MFDVPNWENDWLKSNKNFLRVPIFSVWRQDTIYDWNIYHLTPTPRCYFNLYKDFKQIKTVSFEKYCKKIDLAPKIAVISIFCWLQPIKSLMLRFGITKLSLITNIHWKFEDFWSSSLRFTKVYNNALRSEDGVRVHLA